MTSALPRAAHRNLQRLFTEGTCTGLTDAQLLERFVASRDGQAFETLIIRHGPMVLAVGRAILGNLEDAEDAFQATFLILARRAGSIRGQAGLGPWLHRVASRVAIQANVRARRQRHREKQAGTARARDLPSHEAQADLRGAVHEELERLPERWRRPVVLCDLEGKTHAQAAAELRWGEATVRRRLAAARDRLRSRLTRQGIVPLAIMLGATDPRGAGAAVPEAWVTTTTKAATGLAAGRGAWLATTVLKRMALSTLKTTAAAGLTFAVLVWAGLAVLATGPEPEVASAQVPNANTERTRPPEAEAADDRPQNQDTETFEIRGHVLDPDGRPRAGAKLYLGRTRFTEEGPYSAPQPLRATSGQDGRFRFAVSRNELARIGNDPADVVLAALAEGSGPAWVRLGPNPGGREPTLTLTRDDVPVTGRVLDLEGRPIARAAVSVVLIRAIPDGDLPAWVQALQANQGKGNPDLWKRMGYFLHLGGPGVLPTARTQSDGRFRLDGIGRDRIVSIAVMGPAIETELRSVLTTDKTDYTEVFLPGGGGKPEQRILYGPDLKILAPPARSIGGIVRDLDTGEPLQGIRIRSYYDIATAVTDAQGRYLITGLRKSRQGQIQLQASSPDQPYVTTEQHVKDTPGSRTIAADFAMKRGVWIEGRVTDRVTGQAVNARVQYAPFLDNPVRAGKSHNIYISAPTNSLGRYRIVGAPGRGVLAVRAPGLGYLTAPPLTPEIEREVRLAFYFQLHGDYEKVDTVNLPSGLESFPHNYQLEPGRGQRVTIVGPDGSPMGGAIVDGVDKTIPWIVRAKETEFTYVHPNPGTVETLIVRQRSKHLGAAIELTGDEPGPLRVTLVPTATVSGRLVDSEGQPRPHLTLLTFSRRKSRGTLIAQEPWTPRISTDDAGRFRVDGLVPGVEYEIRVLGKKGSPSTARPLSARWWALAPGESKDWGDVRESPPGEE